MNIAFCGFNCDDCPMCKLSKEFKNEENNPNYCLGCKSEKRSKYCESGCYIRKCNIEKSIDNCKECSDFPCEYIKNNLSEESITKIYNL